MGAFLRRRATILAIGFALTMICVGAGAQTTSQRPPGLDPNFELDPVKQKYIWDAEHIVFKLETYFSKPFVSALIAGKKEGMLSFFRDDFSGKVIASSRDAQRQSGILVERRRDVESGGSKEANSEAIVKSLLGSIREIKKASSGRLRVLHIDRLPDGAWEAKLLLTVGGIGKSGAIVEMESGHHAVFRFKDAKEITPEAQIISLLEERWEVRRESPRPLMEEATEAFGLDKLPLLDNWNLEPEHRREYRHQIAVDDFNRDGYLDIAVGTIEGDYYLLKSVKGRRFEEVAAPMGIKPGEYRPRKILKQALTGWIDYDNDGYPDLILGERLYHNVEGKRFEDVTEGSGLWFDRVPMGTTVADYDLDGDLDLYVTYLKSSERRAPGFRPWVGDVDSGGRNMLWRNEGGGRFKDVTGQTGAAGGKRQTFAATFLYLDDDHLPDLYVANDFGKNVVLRNKGDGTFEPVTDAVGIGDYSTSMGVSTGDLDNDGSSEIYVANMYSKMGRRIIAHINAGDYPTGVHEQIVGSCAGNRLYRQTDSPSDYREEGTLSGVNAVGWAYAPRMVDLNGDGLLDLYATTGFMSYERGKPDG